jgi:type II restriction/modification system DNA methylase subunit YeeA
LRSYAAFTQTSAGVTILDPACGTGNFLYVALEHLKRLEAEILDLLASLGETPTLEGPGLSVDPHQLLGIEANPRAAAITELVLWIGYLQWHFRIRANAKPAEPVLRNFRNIKQGDALLTWQREELMRGPDCRPLSRWDGQTRKPHRSPGRWSPTKRRASR